MSDPIDIRAVMGRGPVIPVVTIDDPAAGPDLARALLAGGISVIEVTLRTPAALEAARAIAAEVPDMILGVGTVLEAEQARAAGDAGAVFAVSPGLDPDLMQPVAAAGLAYLPGVQTTSEVMAARRLGLRSLKFFPAKVAGGPAALKQFQPLFPDIAFCPTGGIGAGDAADYLALGNVLCVGGSFAAPNDAVAARDWARVTELARQAGTLGG